MSVNLKLVLLMTFILGACSSKEPEKKPVVYPEESPEVTTTRPKGTSIVAKQVATEQGSNLVTELKSKKGKSSLSSQDRSEIKTLFEKAKSKGKIEEVQLITWADKNFPNKEKGKLAKEQVDLVQNRNEALEKYLKQLDDNLEIKKISMAERAGGFEKFTATDEAEIKDALSAKDAPGKTGEAMIIFILEK